MKTPAVVLAICLCVGALLARPPGRERQRAEPDRAMFQRDNDRFQEVAPRVGESLPDVIGFDEQRKPINLRDLKGSYAVLVSGCLT